MTNEGDSDGDGRVYLADDELLFRQVLLPLRDGRPSWETFKGRKADDWQVSVDREALCDSPQNAYSAYTAGGANSYGTLATSVSDLDGHGVGVYEKPEDDNPAHCQYDLRLKRDGAVITNGGRERICVDLFDRAMGDDRPRFMP
jgi:hypothetical protein